MIYKIGSKGDAVKKIQQALHIMDDGIFGKLTQEAVMEFQRNRGLVVDGIVGNETWDALFPDDGYKVKHSSRSINEIIVHCSATPEGKDYSVADIRRWHLQRGFSDIGYHYVVYRDGSIHEGRNVHQAGAHCSGHNANSIGVCYVGGLARNGVPKDTRTKAQRESLIKLVKALMVLYKLPSKRVFGHYQFANKACPSFDIVPFRTLLDA